MLGNRKRRLVAQAGALAGLALGLLTLSAPSAFAGTITSPTFNPFTPTEISTPFTFPAFTFGGPGGTTVPPGAPLPFSVSVTGYAPSTNLFLEICDGMPATMAGWSPALDCDGATAPPALQTNSGGDASWSASSPSQQVFVFRGISPSDLFNCAAQFDVPLGFVNGQNPPSAATLNGETMDPNMPAWTNCQLRVSSDTSLPTVDQAFITLQISNQPPVPVPEFPYALVAPVAAVGILAAGLLLARRRRPAVAE